MGSMNERDPPLVSPTGTPDRARATPNLGTGSNLRPHGDASRTPNLAGWTLHLRWKASGKAARARNHEGEALDLRAPTPILEGETRDDRG
jgi:hypothetical protein